MPTRFLLWDRWHNQASLTRHFSLPHALAYIDRDLSEIVQVFQTDVISLPIENEEPVPAPVAPGA